MSPTPSVTRPIEIASASEAAGLDAFFLAGEHTDAWFERGSDILIVSFYNLATVGEHELPHPWFYGNALKQNYSILGLIAHRKDWYRNDDAPRLLTELREAGVFEGFRRILFIGTSMGGFAALTYSSLVPGAAVLAFSPQSTLAPEIVPFEKRYKRAQKLIDWTAPAHLDAAGSFEHASDVTIVYDPHVPEDKAHAARLAGDNVQFIHARHMGHQAIRLLKHLDALPLIFKGVAEDNFDRAGFFRQLRTRRSELRWLRGLFGAAHAQGHQKLLLATARSLKTDNPRMRRYLNRVSQRFEEEAKLESDHSFVASDPPPEAPFSGEIVSLVNALVVPQTAPKAKHAFGVLTSEGAWCEMSQTWIMNRLASRAPTIEQGEVIEPLPGTHLFAGHFRGHFGHFLVESTSRLWALDHIGVRPDSILYVPFGEVEPGQHTVIEKYKTFFHLLDIDMPVQSFGSTMRVERLLVPEIGFGWVNRFAGSPAYRQFFQSRLMTKVKPEGPPDLYVSRSKLRSHLGQIIGEQVIERNLARLGYDVFYPEKHPIEVQLARYKAARRIVALDGSALHLVPFVMAPGGSVAMIKRRSTANIDDYRQQFRAFCGVEVDGIDALKHDWISNDKNKIDMRSVGELDFVSVFQQLADAGYVPSDFKPDLPNSQEMDALRETAILNRNGQLRQVGATSVKVGS
ncbi:glycosyltransferase family 61 protein [uncultured Shimia sp.]|uniref:glycosyltransferase family 61 protein n=1 Tax=uncultured Shimia sp. TaxID=573152 RepID=UPI00261E7BE8|nr:glycosyltransferase family 61 protein [uncultured Shimia sp.]